MHEPDAPVTGIKEMGASAGGPAHQGSNRRIAQRFRIRGPVHLQTEFDETWGTLADISVTGARIEEVSQRLKPGTRLRAMFCLIEGCVPVKVDAAVVRETEDGFAIEFIQPEPRLRRVIQAVLSKAKQG